MDKISLTWQCASFDLTSKTANVQVQHGATAGWKLQESSQAATLPLQPLGLAPGPTWTSATSAVQVIVPGN